MKNNFELGSFLEEKKAFSLKHEKRLTCFVHFQRTENKAYVSLLLVLLVSPKSLSR